MAESNPDSKRPLHLRLATPSAPIPYESSNAMILSAPGRRTGSFDKPVAMPPLRRMSSIRSQDAFTHVPDTTMKRSNHKFSNDAVLTVYGPERENPIQVDQEAIAPFLNLSDPKNVDGELSSSIQVIIPSDNERVSMNSKKTGLDMYRMWAALKKLSSYKVIVMIQVVLAAYAAIVPYAVLRDEKTGLIIDPTSPERTEKGLLLVNGIERAIVADTLFQVVSVGICRLSAYFMYPALILVFVTKFRATISFLDKSPISMFMPGDLHELHVYCGWTILVCSLIHSALHLGRWAQQGNLSLLIEHSTGVTGLVVLIALVLICIPMMICRKQIKYEIRKRIHYFFIIFALAMCFHTTTKAIPYGGYSAYVFGTLLVWYFLDASYCTFFMTEKIETTRFDVLPNGFQMTMQVSDFFQKNGAHGGYCYVCLPWIDRNQWHAFSLFEDPANPLDRQIFVQKAGDWTKKVHRMVQRDTVRPAWVQGPFPSPYNSANAYDNQILVASGIGITPALSVIRAHKDSRRINLIWAVRDRHLLEFFLRHLYLDHDGWNLIFYTGKEDIGDALDIYTNTNVCVILGRPNLRNLVPNIIYGIESGRGLPENYIPESSMRQDEESLKSFESEFSDETTPLDLDLSFKPWESILESEAFVKSLSKEAILSTWGMLYCGSAKSLEKEMKRVSDRYHLDLHIESFDW